MELRSNYGEFREDNQAGVDDLHRTLGECRAGYMEILAELTLDTAGIEPHRLETFLETDDVILS
jgi:hypothetical protein